MICPKCNFENPENGIFCGHCGSRMETICPNCSFANPVNFKFCGKCGQSLKLIPISEKTVSVIDQINTIKRYLPKGLMEKILAQKDSIEGERKQVTVMFCDIFGFTEISESLGPERTYDIMDAIYKILIQKVHDYEGTVNELTGDGIMALFGAPIAMENAPQRAILSSLAIHREMSTYSSEISSQYHLPPIKIRIGINTGPVVIGALGSDLRVEFKVAGDTVNLASRLENLANPGTTYVTCSTFDLTEGLFRFEALGQTKIKGKKEPVSIYRVIAPSSRRTRFDVNAERGLTPFVGRKRELELLLEGYKNVISARGHAFSIIAEAGIGKSRILYEFRKSIAHENITFLEGRCLSHGKSIAYLPIIEILKSNFDIVDGDADSEVTEKVKNGLQFLNIDQINTLPFILELLSVRDSGLNKFQMSPESRKDRIMNAVKQMVLKGSEIRPLVLAIEDLQWMDRSSEELIKSLLSDISGARVMLIFTYRLDYIHSWGAKSYHNQITLNRLSNLETVEMAAHILKTDKIEPDLTDLILGKTEGVPFFIEEFIKALLDFKIIDKKNRYQVSKDLNSFSIPVTIQDVIMARIDNLPQATRFVLQTGSAIEREFNFDIIKLVTEMQSEELLMHLSTLKDAELIYERGIFPNSTYIFKHALTREVIYETILEKNRVKLHGLIGGALEKLYQDNHLEHSAIITEHFWLGQDYTKSAYFAALAAKKEEKAASFQSAIYFSKKRVDSLEKLPPEQNRDQKLIDARTAYGTYMIQMTYIAEAKEAVAPIFHLAKKMQYNKRLSQILIIYGAYSFYIDEDLSAATQYLEEALKISVEEQSIISTLLASYYLGVIKASNCEFKKSIEYLNTALEFNQAAKNLWGISVMKSHLSYECYNYQDQIELSQKTSRDAVVLADTSGDIYSKSLAYTAHGISSFLRGDLEVANQHLSKGIEFCERINFLSWKAIAHSYSGEVHFENGDYASAEIHYQKAIEDFEKVGILPSAVNVVKFGQERINVIKNKARPDIEKLYEYLNANKFKRIQGLMLRNLSEILLYTADGFIDDAENTIKNAIQTDKANSTLWNLGRDYLLYSELLKIKNENESSKIYLEKANTIFDQCGALGWKKKIDP